MQSEKMETSSNEWSTFVRRCKDAISVENNSWMAKWDEVAKNEKQKNIAALFES